MHQNQTAVEFLPSGCVFRLLSRNPKGSAVSTFAVASEAISTSTTEAVFREARIGLTATPKTLSPWLFYDEAGSHLFEQITELPEYYLTRTERSIFAAHAEEILREAAHGRAGG